MTLPFFILAFAVYSIYAALPFLHIQPKYHYMIGICLSVVAGICWTTISRAVAPGQVVIYGMYFDAQLTIAFLITPFFFTGFNLTLVQNIGILVMLIGMVIVKF